MTTDAQLDSIAGSLAAIERHLATIADYASFLHIQATGEKTFQVQRFVVGRDSEDNPCIWLYGTHPGLEFAVTRIYHETLPALPLTIPDDAKIWDGEQAPSTDKAARGGYFCLAPAPFTISLMPTGKKTDGGLDIRRFSRVVSIDTTSNGAPTNGAPSPVLRTGEPSAPASGPNSDGDFDGLPGHARSAYVPATKTGKPADPEPPAKPAFMTSKRPWTGDTAIDAMRFVADAKATKGEGVSEQDGKFGAVIGLLDAAPFDTDCRRELLRQVFNVESAKDLTGAQRLALVTWGKPAPVGPGPKAPWALAVEAVTEYRRILGWADSAGTAEDEIPF